MGSATITARATITATATREAAEPTRSSRRFSRRRSSLAAALLCASGVALGAPAAADIGQARFQAGIGAFQAGDYAAALDAFLDARKRGVRDPNLDFDLALTYYRLGRYEEARDEFLKLRQDLSFTPIADYHLGLTEMQLGHREEALGYLQGAQAMATDVKLQRLVEIAIARLQVMEVPRVDEEGMQHPDVSFYFLGGVGYDSNPALVSESLSGTQQSADQGSGYVELVGDAELPMVTTRAGTSSLYTELGARQYFSDNDFDQQNAEIGLRQDWRGGDWRLVGEGGAGIELFGGEVLQRNAGAQLQVRRDITGGSLRARYRAERVDGGEEFGYLDGWRHVVAADARRTFGKLRLRIDYSLELNDRRDEDLGDEFFSHSPTRHAIGLAVGRTPYRSLSMELRLRYRLSRYGDADRFLDDAGTLHTQTRDEKLSTVGVRTRWLRGKGWAGLLDYQYSRNESNLDGYDYSRHLVLIGIEWLR